MNELLRRWSELEPGAWASPAGGRALPGGPEDPGGQNLLLHVLWRLIEERAWRWVMLHAPAGEQGVPPYLARVTVQGGGKGQTRRGDSPAHALLAAYVALLEHRPGSAGATGDGA